MPTIPARAPRKATGSRRGSRRGSGLARITRAEDALFRPVRAGNAFEETVERLLTAIKLGVAVPGSRLPAERDLAERLGVSRVTLREAIRALQHSGYVESRRGRYGGTFVSATLPTLTKTAARRLTKKTGHDLGDTLTLRDVLECGAAEQAARARPAAGSAEAAALVARLEEAAGAGDVAEYRRLDSRFHLAVAEVAGSPSLTAAVAQVRMRVNAFLDAIPVLEPNVAHSERQHAAIVAAILAGDAASARRAMGEHVSATAALLRGFLG
jgi:DNA-binding FadR family transcriptional regulator